MMPPAGNRETRTARAGTTTFSIERLL
jgi:hypothetical protein